MAMPASSVVPLSHLEHFYANDEKRLQQLRSIVNYMMQRGGQPGLFNSVPTIEGKVLDLVSLFEKVIHLDGFQCVTETQWAMIVTELGLTADGNTIFALKMNYSRYLFPFEQMLLASRNAGISGSLDHQQGPKQHPSMLQQEVARQAYITQQSNQAGKHGNSVPKPQNSLLLATQKLQASKQQALNEQARAAAQQRLISLQQEQQNTQSNLQQGIPDSSQLMYGFSGQKFGPPEVSPLPSTLHPLNPVHNPQIAPVRRGGKEPQKVAQDPARGKKGGVLRGGIVAPKAEIEGLRRKDISSTLRSGNIKEVYAGLNSLLVETYEPRGEKELTFKEDPDIFNSLLDLIGQLQPPHRNLTKVLKDLMEIYVSNERACGKTLEPAVSEYKVESRRSQMLSYAWILNLDRIVLESNCFNLLVDEQALRSSLVILANSTYVPPNDYTLAYSTECLTHLLSLLLGDGSPESISVGGAAFDVLIQVAHLVDISGCRKEHKEVTGGINGDDNAWPEGSLASLAPPYIKSRLKLAFIEGNPSDMEVEQELGKEDMMYVCTVAFLFRACYWVISCCCEKSLVKRSLTLLHRLSMVSANQEIFQYAPELFLQRLVDLLHIPAEGSLALLANGAMIRANPAHRAGNNFLVDIEIRDASLELLLSLIGQSDRIGVKLGNIDGCFKVLVGILKSTSPQTETFKNAFNILKLLSVVPENSIKFRTFQAPLLALSARIRPIADLCFNDLREIFSR